MAYQGEYFTERYGKERAAFAPPIRRMLDAGVPVAAGTDATRVASYNPWVALHWLVAGKTVGGLRIYDERNRLDRTTALRLWTDGGSWFSRESGKKGRLVEGQLGDLAVLSADYFSVPENEIKNITSVLTVVGGRVVYADGPFGSMAPPPPPVSPDWSPVRTSGGYYHGAAPASLASGRASGRDLGARPHRCSGDRLGGATGLWGATGCSCFAF